MIFYCERLLFLFVIFSRREEIDVLWIKVKRNHLKADLLPWSDLCGLECISSLTFWDLHHLLCALQMWLSLVTKELYIVSSWEVLYNYTSLYYSIRGGGQWLSSTSVESVWFIVRAACHSLPLCLLSLLSFYSFLLSSHLLSTSGRTPVSAPSVLSLWKREKEGGCE